MATRSPSSRRGRSPAPAKRATNGINGDVTHDADHTALPAKLRPAIGAEMSGWTAPSASPSTVLTRTGHTADASTSTGTSSKPRPTEVHGASTDVFEFGGPWGAFGEWPRAPQATPPRQPTVDPWALPLNALAATAGIMVFSHCVLYGMFYTIVIKHGALAWPTADDWAQLIAKCTPTWHAAGLYFAFLVTEVVFAYVMPGLDMWGRPDESGRRLKYLCNAYASWWATLGGLLVAHYTGWFPLASYIDHLGAVMTVAVVFGNALSIALYVYAHATGTTHRMTGYVVYDYFMGAILHPRIGILDIKVRWQGRSHPLPQPSRVPRHPPAPPATRRCSPRSVCRGFCCSSWTSAAASRWPRTRRHRPRPPCHPPCSCAWHTSCMPTRVPRGSTMCRRR